MVAGCLFSHSDEPRARLAVLTVNAHNFDAESSALRVREQSRHDY
jgi:hypothetical protein